MVLTRGCGGDDVEAECTRSWYDGACDAAEADQSQCKAREPSQRRSRGQLILPLFRVEMEKGGLPDGREQQCDRVVGNFGDAVVGHKSDGNVTLGAGIDGDVVQADAKTGDNSAVWGGIQEPESHLSPTGGDRIDAGCKIEQCGFAGVGGVKHFRPNLTKNLLLDLGIRPCTIGDQHSEAVGHLCALGVGGSEFGHADGWLDDPVPVLAKVVGWPTLFGNGMSHVDCLDHFDRVPRTDQQFVGIGFLGGDVDTDFASNATFHIDFAPGLQDRNGGARHLVNAIDRANLQARLATSAVVGVDDCHFLGQFLAGASLGHGREPFVRILG